MVGKESRSRSIRRGVFLTDKCFQEMVNYQCEWQFGRFVGFVLSLRKFVWCRRKSEEALGLCGRGKQHFVSTHMQAFAVNLQPEMSRLTTSFTIYGHISLGGI